MLKLSKAKRAKGELRVPSDKSISHRAVIFSALAEGESYVKEWLSSEDTLATLNMLIALGVEVKKDGKNLRIKGRDYSFVEPSYVLDAKTLELLQGLCLESFPHSPFLV